jgi:hypothetical protein
MTVDELDAAILAGDTSVIEIDDRLAAGVDPLVIVAELLLGVNEAEARRLVEEFE